MPCPEEEVTLYNKRPVISNRHHRCCYFAQSTICKITYLSGTTHCTGRRFFLRAVIRSHARGSNLRQENFFASTNSLFMHNKTKCVHQIPSQGCPATVDGNARWTTAAAFHFFNWFLLPVGDGKRFSQTVNTLSASSMKMDQVGNGTWAYPAKTVTLF